MGNSIAITSTNERKKRKCIFSSEVDPISSIQLIFMMVVLDHSRLVNKIKEYNVEKIVYVCYGCPNFWLARTTPREQEWLLVA